MGLPRTGRFLCVPHEESLNDVTQNVKRSLVNEALRAPAAADRERRACWAFPLFSQTLHEVSRPVVGLILGIDRPVFYVRSNQVSAAEVPKV